MSSASLCRKACHALLAIALLSGAIIARAADTYDPATHQLSIPSLVIGNATFTNAIVTVGAVVSLNNGSTPGAPAVSDSYDPATAELAAPAVVAGGTTYTNVVVKVTGLVSVGSVAGADTYDGQRLTIASVLLPGTSLYTRVVVTIGKVVAVNGGMPAATQDMFDPASSRLTIPAASFNGRVYTNIVATVGSILALNGGHLVSLGVTPISNVLVNGTTQAYAATGTFSDSSSLDLTRMVTWQSSNPGVAVISNGVGSVGVATAVQSGNAVITATLPGLLASETPLTVVDVLADVTQVGPTVQRDQTGANMNVGFDISQPASQGQTLAGIGVNLVRWPGGGPADMYHWQTNTWSGAPCPLAGGTPNPNSTYDDFSTALVAAGGQDVAITVNYGSNPQCNGPADPNEAAAWVAYAKAKGYPVKYWTVGNEVYGAGSVDLHTSGSHDPLTYATNVAQQFYPLMKAQDPNAQVGVVVDAGNYSSDDWDTIVLANARYDFVEVHRYAETPGQESDEFLLNTAPALYASTFAKLKAELAAAGHPDTPILLGEYNSPNYNPGKQTLSIVNALFIAMVQGEILKAGIAAATIEDGFFGECNDTGNNSASLYGWQNFGSYALFAGTSPNCAGEAGIAANTPFPIARALALTSQFAVPGNSLLGVSVASSLSQVRAYAAQQGSGYALMLLNLDQNNPVTLTLAIPGATALTRGANMLIYDRQIYDQSQQGVWAAPFAQPLGLPTLPLQVTLTPWSINVITLQ